MPRTFSMIISVPLLVAFSTTLGSDDSAKQAVKTLTELRETISKQLPAGWTASISPVEPALVISSDKPVPVEYRKLASFQLAKQTEEQVKIRLVAMAYVSPEEHKQIQQQNDACKKKRLRFEDENLSHLFRRVISSNKIERPYPPATYAPEADKEKELITEYALLWLNTQARNLPTHHYKNLSFRLEGLEDGPMLVASIADKQGEKQYLDILKMLEKVAPRYE